MKKIDMHFHTKMSDGNKGNEEIIDSCIEKGLECAIPTDHDVINGEFNYLMREKGIWSTNGVEVSARDMEDGGKSMHLLLYSNYFSQELIDILENTRNGKIKKIKNQIEQLNDNGFIIDYDKFIKYFISEGFKVEYLNNAHIVDFLFQYESNKQLIKSLTKQDFTKDNFIKECLSRNGDFSEIGCGDVEEYEPTVEKIGEIAFNNGYLLSLAHPNFTFKNMIDFKLFFYTYIEYIKGLEINSKTSKKWVKTIMQINEKTNGILTFGSDDHFGSNNPFGKDEKHGNLGDINPFLKQEDVQNNFKKFQNFISN